MSLKLRTYSWILSVLLVGLYLPAAGQDLDVLGEEKPAAEPAEPAATPDAETPDDTAPAAAAAQAQPAAAEEGEAAEPGEEPAEEPAAEAGSGVIPGFVVDIFNTGAIALLINGGIFMWPILVMGIIAVGVIIERYRTLKMLRTDSRKLRRDVLRMMQKDEVEQALNRCEQETGPVPAILSAGIRKYLVLRRLNYDPARIEEQVIKAIDDYGVHVVAALEKHLPVLATVASAAPMLGFLGTVQGMIVAFNDIEAGIGSENIVKLAAAGIKVSLLTTCFGLIVGIPAYVGFNYFTSIINTFVLDVEESASELIEAVTLEMSINEQASDTPSEPVAETAR